MFLVVCCVVALLVFFGIFPFRMRKFGVIFAFLWTQRRHWRNGMRIVSFSHSDLWHLLLQRDIFQILKKYGESSNPNPVKRYSLFLFWFSLTFWHQCVGIPRDTHWSICSAHRNAHQNQRTLTFGKWKRNTKSIHDVSTDGQKREKSFGIFWGNCELACAILPRGERERERKWERNERTEWHFFRKYLCFVWSC